MKGKGKKEEGVIDFGGKKGKKRQRAFKNSTSRRGEGQRVTDCLPAGKKKKRGGEEGRQRGEGGVPSVPSFV